MKASDLRPGQFFEFVDKRERYRRVVIPNRPDIVYYIDAQHVLHWCAIDLEVNPNVPQCWEGEERLQVAYNGRTAEEWYTLYSQEILREPSYQWLHRYYVAAEDYLSVVESAQDVFESHIKDGELIGDGQWRVKSIIDAADSLKQASKAFVAAMDADPPAPSLAAGEGFHYLTAGEVHKRFMAGKSPDTEKAAVEVPAPQPFKPGDWVVCVDAGTSGLLVAGEIVQIEAIHGTEANVFIGKRGKWMSDGWKTRRFRHAAPAEVEAHLKGEGK